MPLIEQSTYQAPLCLFNRHLQTIYPALFRHISVVTTEKERIHTPDGDFLDLCWTAPPHSKRLAILSHGLEGSAHASYIQGMARALSASGWSVLSWNFRNCSGEPNHRLRSYHSGAIDDLQTVIKHVFQTTQAETVALIGFSLGGNMTLKLLGDCAAQLDPRIRAAVAFSVPCDLAGSSMRLEQFSNQLYMRRFLKTLRAKVREKVRRFPGQISDDGLDQINSFRAFDGAYTAPIHGFKSAEDYWQRCSCTTKLHAITVPTLLINAQNDPFLTPTCYPIEIAKQSPTFYLEMPKQGGHIGFTQFTPNGTYWSELRSVEFLNKHCHLN
jgi:predicted alpha/beta-fold hydrolase